ncbi:LPXTG cell wall anchor domain-containing protein [Vagococcus fluvialis]|uniref:LPXTG cell wall anchor domain-containing protein n=1 Tax=Vagococcus fluvialis TaxID=2738 RepID=UPI001A8E133B|nr:LPXTG cell wall anchor domain-containing protein [Vagococcus fluvialis]MBO0427809.1 LPXTG cell wall anchor domain-containing protein [Vagococcus fluvialis]
MKKKILGIVLLSVVMLGQSNVLAVEESKPKEDVEQVAEKQNANFKNYTIDQTKINIDGSGVITLGKVNETQLEGKFVPTKNEFVELKEDGTFIGLKAGKTKLTPVVILSEKSLKELNQTDIAKTLLDNQKTSQITLEPLELEIQDRKQEMVTITSGYTLSSKTVKEKESITISREAYKGTALKGSYKPVNNQYASLSDTGVIKGLKKGKTTLDVEYTINEQTVNEIKKAYLKELNKPELTVDDITVVDQNKQSSVPVEVLANEPKEETIELPIKKEYVLDKSTIKLNETAKVSIKDIYGVKVAGDFKEANSDWGTLNKAGILTPKKAGSLKLVPDFVISEASKKAIKESYIKESGKDNLKVENINLVETNQTEGLNLTIQADDKVKKVTIDITPSIKANKQELKVGEAGGKLTVDSLYGVTLKGKFKAVKNPVIDFKEDGTFIGLQAGTVELAPNYEISQESLDEIANVFLKQEQYSHLTRSDVEFIHKDVQPVIPIKFTSTTNNNQNNNNNSGKTYVPAEQKRTLPQTGEKRALLASAFGLFLVIGSSLIFKSRNS